MPNSLLESRSEFDHKKALLGQWLRDNIRSTGTLSRDQLKDTYGEHKFIAGWSVELEPCGTPARFDVLIDGRFPYSPIRVSYRSQEVYLKWPHVEPGGLLCLPRRAAPTAGIEPAILGALQDSRVLVERCQDPKFIETELQHEFVSYWNRSQNKGANPVRSLLEPTNTRCRSIAVWYGENYTLAGENSDELLGWLENSGRKDPSKIAAGVFAYLDHPPAPPFPDRPADLFALLQTHAPDALSLLERVPVNEKVTVVLGASSPSGDGLISLTVSIPRDFDGFRKSARNNLHTKLALWKVKSGLTRREIKRYDAAWIHGRGRNKYQPALRAANALLLGCGSLGSQVAFRLAQSGLGGLVLVDPDELSTANVGRHSLGIDSVGLHKATALANALRRHFPHLRRIEGYPISWQMLYERQPSIFTEATLIVACLGDWSEDGQLSEWQAREHRFPAIVYGWLDEFGVAAHAVALTPTSPGLSCILDPDGALRIPESLWEGDGLVQAEPACGTLFQPYGPIDVAHAEALTSRLCIELLTGIIQPPRHRVYAGSTAQLNEAGGEWSPHHLKFRPQGFDGAFEYERPIMACGQCLACLERF